MLLKSGGPLAPVKVAAETHRGGRIGSTGRTRCRNRSPRFETGQYSLGRRQGTGDRGQEEPGDRKHEGINFRTDSLSPVPCSPEPKVSDFGLAKRLMSDLTPVASGDGHTGVHGPEQAGKAKFVGPGADLYAIGVILYECITGKVPFDSPDTWSLFSGNFSKTRHAAAKARPQCAARPEIIWLKCLKSEPHDRYPTAAALADDLDRFPRGRTVVSGRPISTFSRVTRWDEAAPSARGT